MAVPTFAVQMKLRDEPRLALFSAEGTLWKVDLADECTLWMIGTGRLKVTSSQWMEYRRLSSGNPELGCRYRLSMFSGLSGVELVRSVASFWRDGVLPAFLETTIEVIRYLASVNFNVWVVTAAPTDLLIPLCDRLPVHRVVGSDFSLNQEGILTGHCSGACCVGLGRVKKIRTIWRQPIQFVAGSALTDEAMMRLARDVAWAVHPHPALAAIARAERWEVRPSPRSTAPSRVLLPLEEELAQRGFR